MLRVLGGSGGGCGLGRGLGSVPGVSAQETLLRPGESGQGDGLEEEAVKNRERARRLPPRHHGWAHQETDPEAPFQVRASSVGASPPPSWGTRGGPRLLGRRGLAAERGDLGLPAPRGAGVAPLISLGPCTRGWPRESAPDGVVPGRGRPQTGFASGLRP